MTLTGPGPRSASVCPRWGRRYYAVVRFAETAALDRWLASPARAAWEERVRPFGHSVRPKMTTTGLDGWPLSLRALVFPVVLAPLLTYAVMPWLSRVEPLPP